MPQTLLDRLQTPQVAPIHGSRFFLGRQLVLCIPGDGLEASPLVFLPDNGVHPMTLEQSSVLPKKAAHDRWKGEHGTAVLGRAPSQVIDVHAGRGRSLPFLPVVTRRMVKSASACSVDDSVAS